MLTLCGTIGDNLFHSLSALARRIGPDSYRCGAALQYCLTPSRLHRSSR